jgi:hypothetical protein
VNASPLSLREVLRARPRFFVAIFLGAWITFLVHFSPAATGSDRYVILMLSLVEQGTLQIDSYRSMTAELATARGHWYLNTNPGTSFLAAPSWAVLQPVMGPPAGGVTAPSSLRFFAAHLVGLATTTAAAGALTCVLLAAVLLQVTGRTAAALLGAALHGWGSIAFFFSTRLQQNVFLAFLAMAIWVLLRAVPSRGTLAAAGFLLGLGLFVDLSAVPLGLSVLAALAWDRRLLSSLLPLALGAALPLAGLALYQQAAFSHPLWPAQAYIPREGTVIAEGLLGLSLPSPARFLPQLVSPGCGLFVFMPWAVLPFLPGGFRERLRAFAPREVALAGSALLFFLLWVGILPSSQFCLYGPRYLLPIVPFLACAAVLALRSWPRLGGALVTAGFLINLAGAQLGFPTDNAARTVAVWLLRGPWLPMVDWLRANWPQGPSMVTPYGLLLAWLTALAALWRLAAAETAKERP